VTQNPAHRAALLASDLFRAMSGPEIEAVLARAAVRHVSRGETVLHRGDPSTGLIVILQGRLRISLVSPEGGEMALGVLGPGEILGEISLLDGRERSADVFTMEPCALLVVERTHILDLLRRDADLCLRLMAVLCKRLRQANETLEDIALLDMPARIARVLQRLAREFGAPTKEGIRIGAKLSQKDIAMLVGASREKVNRELRALEDRGTIGKQDGHLVILRPQDLDPAL
jgi:CRP/FNR family transcriptional regulator, cyclic AMP receptor protein